MMLKLQPWYKSIAGVKARTMYFFHSICLGYNVQFMLRNFLKHAFIFLVKTGHKLLCFSSCIKLRLTFWKKHGGHNLRGAGKLVAKIKLTLHLLQQQNLTNEARSASMRSTDNVSTWGTWVPLLCRIVVHNMPRLSTLLSQGYSKNQETRGHLKKKQTKKPQQKIVFKHCV